MTIEQFFEAIAKIAGHVEHIFPDWPQPVNELA